MVDSVNGMDRDALLADLAARLSVSTMQVAADCCTEQLRKIVTAGRAQTEHYKALGFEDMAAGGSGVDPVIAKLALPIPQT